MDNKISSTDQWIKIVPPLFAIFVVVMIGLVSMCPVQSTEYVRPRTPVVIDLKPGELTEPVYANSFQSTAQILVLFSEDDGSWIRLTSEKSGTPEQMRLMEWTQRHNRSGVCRFMTYDHTPAKIVVY